ncbi:MAG: hypothetical protein B6I28_06505 [Fusobacteriia bacterium 4572_132]|nr:MAG: hypothetical protein B6I28_06505 [Fusobacteriia bacterium 4572_132]
MKNVNYANIKIIVLIQNNMKKMIDFKVNGKKYIIQDEGNLTDEEKTELINSKINDSSEEKKEEKSDEEKTELINSKIKDSSEEKKEEK